MDVLFELNNPGKRISSIYSYDDRLSGLDVAATQERIRILIERSGLKDKEISKALGVTPQAVNKWRHKGCFLDIENLLILSGLLRVDIEDLLVPRARKIRTETEDVPESVEEAAETSTYLRICTYKSIL